MSGAVRYLTPGTQRSEDMITLGEQMFWFRCSTPLRELGCEFWPDEIAVTLELTEREAAVLYYLTLRGVHWAKSGGFGAAAEDINCALRDVVNLTAGYVSDRPPFTYPVWKKI